MRIHHAGVATALGLALAVAGEAHADTTVLFDFTTGRGAQAVEVGSGSLTTSSSLTTGFQALSNVGLTFQFGATSYSATLPTVDVDVSADGKTLTLTGSPTGLGNTQHPVLQLGLDGENLSFGLTTHGSPLFSEKGGGDYFAGSYLATVEPSFGLGGLTTGTTTQSAPAPATGIGFAGLLGLCLTMVAGRLRHS